jgi:hypothetical protein
MYVRLLRGNREVSVTALILAASVDRDDLRRGRNKNPSTRPAGARHWDAQDRVVLVGAKWRSRTRLLDVGRRIPARDRFAPDSPLEESGFEPLVPLATEM